MSTFESNHGEHIGRALDDFLDEDDLLAETETAAMKRVIAWQIESLMSE